MKGKATPAAAVKVKAGVSKPKHGSLEVVAAPQSSWGGVDEHEPTEDDIEHDIQQTLAGEDAALPDVVLTSDMVIELHVLEERDAGKSAAVREQDFATHLTHIRLDRQRIADVPQDVVARFPALTHVYLQHNRLTSTAPLALLHGLTFLTVAHNRLTRVEGLSQLKGLLFLDVSHNRLDQLPAKCLPTSLRFLLVSGNPCMAEGSPAAAATQAALLDHLTNLRELDGDEVVPDDWQDDGLSSSTAAATQGRAAEAASRLDDVSDRLSGMLSALESLERQQLGLTSLAEDGALRAAALGPTATPATSSTPLQLSILARSASGNAAQAMASPASKPSNRPTATAGLPRSGSHGTTSALTPPSSNRTAAGGSPSSSRPPSTGSATACGLPPHPHDPPAPARTSLNGAVSSAGPASPAPLRPISGGRSSSSGGGGASGMDPLLGHKPPLPAIGQSSADGSAGLSSRPASSGGGGGAAAPTAGGAEVDFERQVDADIAAIQGRLAAMLQLASISVDQARAATSVPLAGAQGGLTQGRRIADAQRRLQGQREVEEKLSGDIRNLRTCSGLAEMKVAFHKRLSAARKAQLHDAAAAKGGGTPVVGVLDGSIPEGHPVLAIRQSLSKLESSAAPVTAVLSGGGGTTSKPGSLPVLAESNGGDEGGDASDTAPAAAKPYDDDSDDEPTINFASVFKQSMALPPNPFK